MGERAAFHYLGGQLTLEPRGEPGMNQKDARPKEKVQEERGEIGKLIPPGEELYGEQTLLTPEAKNRIAVSLKSLGDIPAEVFSKTIYECEGYLTRRAC